MPSSKTVLRTILNPLNLRILDSIEPMSALLQDTGTADRQPVTKAVF